MPRSIFGKCRAACMYLRMIFAAVYLCLFSAQAKEADVIFVDQVSHCVPILRLLSNARILFYCHYPDQLLSKPGSTLKSLYRLPLDKFEEYSTGRAHKVQFLLTLSRELLFQILVNSEFTLRVFRETFKTLKNVPVDVLYPGKLNTKDDSSDFLFLSASNESFCKKSTKAKSIHHPERPTRYFFC